VSAPVPADPGVYISSSQMYQEVRSLHDAVSRVEAKLDQIRDDGRAVASSLQDHELRIRSLERARWPLPTIGALAGVLGAVTAGIALVQR
jgi:hypothetical protein